MKSKNTYPISLKFQITGWNKSVGDSKGIKIVFWHSFDDKIESGVLGLINSLKPTVKKNEGVAVFVELEHYSSYSI